MDEIKRKFPIEAVARVVENRASIEDVRNFADAPEKNLIESAYRNFLFRGAVDELDKKISSTRQYVRFCSLKLALFVLGCGFLGGLGYFYLHFDCLLRLDRFGIYGHVLFFAVCGLALANFFDYTFLNFVTKKELKQQANTLLSDFFKTFDFASEQHGGCWLRVPDILEEIAKKTGTHHDILEVEAFLRYEPFIVSKIEKGQRLYFLTKNIEDDV